MFKMFNFPRKTAKAENNYTVVYGYEYACYSKDFKTLNEAIAFAYEKKVECGWRVAVRAIGSDENIVF